MGPSAAASSDSAQTWTAPVKLQQANHTTRSNGIALSSGELLVPLHTRGTKAGGVMKSRDGGQTWTRFGSVANPEGQGGEPMRVALTETMNFEGATGPITFEPALAISKAVPILKVKDGDFAFVETLVP
jgi:hypothetical protein